MSFGRIWAEVDSRISLIIPEPKFPVELVSLSHLRISTTMGIKICLSPRFAAVMSYWKMTAKDISRTSARKLDLILSLIRLAHFSSIMTTTGWWTS